MFKYPMKFSSRTQSVSGIQSAWFSESGKFRTDLSIPPEFEGSGAGLSPEDLFNQALTNCFVATFKVYAEKSNLNFESISAQADLTVDFDETKKPVMKDLKVLVTIAKPSDSKLAEQLAKKASRSGFILNSVKTSCEFQIQIA